MMKRHMHKSYLPSSFADYCNPDITLYDEAAHARELSTLIPDRSPIFCRPFRTGHHIL